MTVRENLELGAFHRLAKQHRSASLEGVLAMFPVLAERQRQSAGTLSGGEQQMLAIARALMARPRLLMLDEPSLGLAPRVVFEIFKTITTIQAQGLTVLLVEQNVQQSLRLADRGYVLENGTIALSGTGPELLSNEDTRRAYLGL
jgi:branched-chain amino acid transport system ATP-binding protein